MNIQNIIHKLLLEEYDKSVKMLSDKAERLCNCRIMDVPVFYFLDYIPQDRDNKNTKQNQAIRELIWCFKNDTNNYSKKRYQYVFNHIRDLLCRLLRECYNSDAKMLTLVCVPASTQNTNDKRWKKFSNSVCKEIGMNNAFNKINIKTEKIPSHYGGSKKSNYSLNNDYFKNTNVIIFDDLITSGRSIIELKKQIEDLGGNVIMAISLGKTKQ